MTLLIWLLFSLLVVTQGLSVKKNNSDDKVLSWPREFKLTAKRISLTAHIVDDIDIWKTSKQSRIDYNNGYVKFYVIRNETYPFGAKYEIHPEATIDQESKTVCVRKVGTKNHRKISITILPSVHGFDPVGEEIINDKNCTKFFYEDRTEYTHSKYTLWAEYDDEHQFWIPVRYEKLDFNIWLGQKEKHEIWDYYGYEENFTLSSVFNVDEYCPNVSSTHIMDSEDINKHLLFVDPEEDEHVDHVFNAFKNTFNRNYADTREHAIRRSIFKRNMRRVIEHNRQDLGYKLGINHFADTTPEERKTYMGLPKRPEGKTGTLPFPYDVEKVNDIVSNLPKEYDARMLGQVSTVKNQDRINCNSSWAFGTTAAVEGALARVNGGKLMDLSSQALIDCAWAYGAHGCKGGSANSAYEWMIDHGLPTEAEYGPYTRKNGMCGIKNMNKTFPIRGFTDVTPLSVAAMKVALVNHGPLSVGINLSDNFYLYSSGIFYDINCAQSPLTHVMTLVGYGERDGDTFWILKNSFGPEWGISGYMYISARDNVCGVASKPTYPVF